MIEFLEKYLQYFYLVLACISIVINIVVLRLKKVPIKKIIKVISLIPQAISNAEKVFPLSNEGENKRNLVKSFVADLFVAYGVERYSQFVDVDGIIEEILKAPQRKEIVEDVSKKSN